MTYMMKKISIQTAKSGDLLNERVVNRMEDDEYLQIADAVYNNISDRIMRSKLVTQVLEQGPDFIDKTDASAVAEIIDSIHLSELSAAMEGNYTVARMTLNKLNKNFNNFMTACQYKPCSEEQFKIRAREIFLETLSPVLKQLDS